MTGIAGGLLLAAGLAAAAVATVASFGLAVPGAIAAVAAAVGVTGASITSGVTGAAGIGCLVGSIVSGRKAEVFVEGQNKKHNTNDNLAMITNGKIATHKAVNPEIQEIHKKREEYKQTKKYCDLTKAFYSEPMAQADLHTMLEKKRYQLGALLTQYYKGTEVDDLLYAIDMSDQKHPKLLLTGDNALKPKFIIDYVKNVMALGRASSLYFTKDNIALVRLGLCLLSNNPQETGNSSVKLTAFTNDTFVKEMSDYIEAEMTKIKASSNPRDQINYNVLSIFKAALNLSDADIQKQEEMENKENNPEN